MLAATNWLERPSSNARLTTVATGSGRRLAPNAPVALPTNIAVQHTASNAVRQTRKQRVGRTAPSKTKGGRPAGSTVHSAHRNGGSAGGSTSTDPDRSIKPSPCANRSRWTSHANRISGRSRVTTAPAPHDATARDSNGSHNNAKTNQVVALDDHVAVRQPPGPKYRPCHIVKSVVIADDRDATEIKTSEPTRKLASTCMSDPIDTLSPSSIYVGARNRALGPMETLLPTRNFPLVAMRARRTRPLHTTRRRLCPRRPRGR